MDAAEKKKVLEDSKTFFRNHIATNHIDNTKKLGSVDAFNINPFLIKYLANFAFGNSSPENIAKALIYPRALGTSINTSFGTSMQYFCNEVLSSFASTTQGIDIEFVDAIDGHKKHCQIKAGPNTINKDDVQVIKNHFRSVINLGRTNGIRIASTDCIVGVFYGEKNDLSTHYKRIDEDYPVIVGQEFWYHLTGDSNFYNDLIEAFAEVAEEMDSSSLFEDVINQLSQDFKD